MLCDECQQREATVFLTQICYGETRKKQLCEPCAGPMLQLAQTHAARSAVGDFSSHSPEEDAAQYLASIDPRFPSEAYRFVMRAVQVALSPSTSPGEHVSGREVAEAFRQLALAEFGTEALAKLAGWRITACDDVGTIVFRMVELGIFGARAEDKAEDFHAIYDFQTAFPTSA